jgi:integrase
MSIDKRTTPRGQTRYESRTRGPDGRERSRSFATKREALDYEATQRAARAKGTWIDPAGAATRFDVWAWRWLDEDEAKSPNARATDRSIIASALIPIFGARPIGEVTTLAVRRIVGSWSAAGLAPRTVRRRYATLSAIMRAAFEDELIGRNPCLGVKLPSVDRATARVVTPSELEALAACLPEAYRPMPYLGAVLGLRISEVLGLRVGSLDLLSRTPTLSVTETVGEARGRLFVKGPKSAAGRRVLPLSEPLVAVLAAHLRRRALTAAHADALVFVAPKGGPIRRTHFRSREWVPACERAGLRGLEFRDLRRSMATALAARGTGMRDAMELFGHSDARLMLEVYAQASEDGKRAATTALGEHFLREHHAEPHSGEMRPAPPGASSR